MLKKKDNLTDLVERLPKGPLTDSNQSDQQVVNIDGEIVTLGHEEVAKIAVAVFKKKLIEHADRYTQSSHAKK